MNKKKGHAFSALLPIVAAAISLCGSGARVLHAQSAVSNRIVVSSEGIPSAYGAPPGISRTRFAPLTTAYVLPPGAVFAGVIYQGDIVEDEPTDHIFTEEVEVGLPCRFGAAFEISQESFDGDFQDRTFSLELRYALADWNKIPLNPTLFAEYKFGSGRVLHEEGEEEEMEDEDDEDGEGDDEDDEDGEEEEEHRPPIPDAYEFRLLLAQDFGHHVEWAANLFYEQEVEGDEGREWGFAQSALIPVFLPEEKLKVGVEMKYVNFTTKDSRDDPTHSFVVGPTVVWKPSRNTRFDVSPLFGVTKDAPDVQMFAVFSMTFGPSGGTETEAEAPASTRNR